MDRYNEQSLDTLCAALAYAMGIEQPAAAAAPAQALCDYVDAAFAGRKADRVVMYNPDAIAQWVYEKYEPFMPEVRRWTELELPLRTVMPSVTPVCFATMYTGAQPEAHGIRRYEKPVLKIDTLFDALIRAGKRAVIIGDTQCSMCHIFRERSMDYFAYDTVEEINARAAELILKDEYDFMAIYNGNYDSTMHKNGPESPLSLAALHANAQAFATFAALVRDNWGAHDTLMGFAMDHGCHEIDGGCGSHGMDMEEDLNIVHRYRAFPAR